MKAPHVCILQTSFAKREDTIAFLKAKVPNVKSGIYHRQHPAE